MLLANTASRAVFFSLAGRTLIMSQPGAGLDRATVLLLALLIIASGVLAYYDLFGAGVAALFGAIAGFLFGRRDG